MALVSFFFGIMVFMYNEVGSKHHVPHAHARYAEYACAMDFEGNVLAGFLPPKQTAVLRAWVLVRRVELAAD